MSALRKLTGVAVTLGMFFALLIAGPPAQGVLAEHAASATQLAMAKKIRKGKIRVILTGIGTYTIQRKSITRTGTTTRTWRVKPGRYTIKAPGATVVPPKVKVRAGKKVKVRVTFPATPIPPAPQINPDSITAGSSHTCGLDSTGKAWCWGRDADGQLGDGNDGQASEYAPVAVASSLTFSVLAAGGSHTCAIDTGGKAWCWGDDGFGQLGDGNDGQADEYAPVPVAGSLSYRALTSGFGHTCGVDTTGKAWCWGNDLDGQLGDGNDGQATDYAPVAVASSLTFASLDAGGVHTCGLDTSGKAWCWGYDFFGQLGDGNDGQADEPGPVEVATSLTFTTVSAGAYHTCGVDPAGTVWCWGNDHYAQLGDGDDGQGNEYAPIPVSGGLRFVHVSAGISHTCGLDAAARAWCWGRDADGQLGDGNDGQGIEFTPVAVASSASYTHLAVGGYHTCALQPSGKASCWGYDFDGEVGDGNDGQADEYAPVPVAGDHTFATTW
jgi:alpha-tubulin suppressor-like RCC1 family protein